MSNLLMGERFVAAYPNLIRALDGDVIAALTLQAINFRSNIIKPDKHGEIWVDLRIPEIANEIGISTAKTQRALQRLRDRSLLIETQAPGYNNKKLWMIDETGLAKLEENSPTNIRERITNYAPADNYKFISEKSSISKEDIRSTKNTSSDTSREAIENANLLADQIEARKELEEVDTTPSEINASDVVAAYVDQHTETFGEKPPSRSIGRLAKESKVLLGEGKQPDLVIEAAKHSAINGHANIASSYTWLLAQESRRMNQPQKESAVSRSLRYLNESFNPMEAFDQKELEQ